MSKERLSDNPSLRRPLHDEYDGDEQEFIRALDEYKSRTGHRFPTCGEILAVLRGLGYRKEPKAP